MITYQDLKTLTTSQEVANALKEAGIKGDKQHACYCPVALLLRKQYKSDTVYVTRNRVVFFDAHGAAIFTEDPTRAIQEFIRDFDEGKYPELIE